MIDDLLNDFDHAIRSLQSVFGPELSSAVLVGLLFSGLSTYFIKATPKLINSSKRILYTRIWAVCSAMFPVLLMYTTPSLTKRLLVALVVGFGAPVAYQLTVWIIGRYSPQTRANLSGDPENAKCK